MPEASPIILFWTVKKIDVDSFNLIFDLLAHSIWSITIIVCIASLFPPRCFGFVTGKYIIVMQKNSIVPSISI